VNGGGDWSSDEEFEQSLEGTGYLQKKSPPATPFGLRKKQRESLTFYIFGILFGGCSIQLNIAQARNQTRAPTRAFRVRRHYPPEFHVNIVESCALVKQ
jgi:hypothetical protein